LLTDSPPATTQTSLQARQGSYILLGSQFSVFSTANAMTPDMPTDLLATIAPQLTGPINFYRRLRYAGDDMDVHLADFPPAEATALRELYSVLSELLPILRDRRDDPAATIEQVLALYERTHWPELNMALRSIQGAHPGHEPTQRMRQVLHDLRGGAYTALSAFIQMLVLDQTEMISLTRLFFLCRDQLKIMRGALRGLDDAGYAADRATKLHGTHLLVEKWQLGLHQVRGQQAQIVVDSRYEGGIAERCLEFSALDRVIYNLINNAVTYSADGQVLLAFAPVEQEDPPKDLRFVVGNRITPEQQQALGRSFPRGVGELFEGGFTTGGQGLGLRICADFVGNAYGLSSAAQGLAEGHFGATIAGDYFITWVHWPIAAD
jgi:signal transduction histidine kinase